MHCSTINAHLVRYALTWFYRSGSYRNYYLVITIRNPRTENFSSFFVENENLKSSFVRVILLVQLKSIRIFELYNLRMLCQKSGLWKKKFFYDFKNRNGIISCVLCRKKYFFVKDLKLTKNNYFNNVFYRFLSIFKKWLNFNKLHTSYFFGKNILYNSTNFNFENK